MNTFFCSMFAFLSLASCTFLNDVAGNEYKLVSPKYPIDVTLGLNKKGGYYGGALNRYFGTYKIKGDDIEFGQMASTKMAGAPEDMKAEDEYFKGISGSLKINTNEDKLILKNQSGQEFVFKKKVQNKESK